MRIDELKGSWEKLGELYPVLVDKNGNVIDGKHRKKANPNWYEKVIDTDDPVRIAMIDFIANVNRREISNSEIKKKLDKIAELTGWSVQQIAVEIGRSGEAGEKWVRRYISERYKDAAQVERIKKRYEGSSVDTMSTETEGEELDSQMETYEPLEEGSKNNQYYEEGVSVLSENEGEPFVFAEDVETEFNEGGIGETGDICRGNVVVEDSYLLKYKDKEEFNYNIWESDGIRGEGAFIYGDPNFHGNTPPVVAYQCLMKYTEENDLVLDPMCGSGTVMDICKGFNRHIIAFDIRPIREGIGYSDAKNLPLDDGKVDFIFAHFPYWDMVEYSGDENDLSRQKLKGFLDKTKEIFKEFYRVLKPSKYLCVLIGDKRRGGLIDLSAQLSVIGIDYFNLWDKIIWVGKKQRSSEGVQNNLTKWRAEHSKYHIQLFDTLLVFRKEGSI